MAMGMHHIAKAVSFLNNDCSLVSTCHESICNGQELVKSCCSLLWPG